MEVRNQKINEYLSKSDIQSVIPVYQRNYDWKKEQCNQLWEDIIKVAQNENYSSHFIGSIVYIHDGIYSSGGVKKLTVIDGQQRLTTLMLLYIAIFNQLDDKKVKEKIKNQYLINPYFDNEEEKIKLKSTENNREAIKYILDNKKIENYDKYSRIIENYHFFSERLKEVKFQTVLDGINKLTFVEIALDRENDNPQKIFESINSTGLNLSQSDLIRNYVLMELEPKIQEHFFYVYWKVIEENTINEADNSRLTAEFIRDFLTIQTKKIPSKNKVYQFFKERYSDIKQENIKNILEELKAYSFHYSKLLSPSKEKDKEIQQHLRWINEIEVSVAYPFLICVYSDYAKNKINKKEFIHVLELVQNYVWRRFLVGLPTSGLNKVFPALYGGLGNKKFSYIENLQAYLLSHTGDSQRFPKNKDVKNSLHNKDMYKINLKNKHYLFEKLERYNNKEYVDVRNNKNITIEHIFPQAPDKEWDKHLPKDERKTMEEKNHTIGNLTLSGNNGSLGNKYFTEKRDMNYKGGEQGYRFSNLRLNKDLKKLEKWNYEEWEKRTSNIADRINKIWTYPPDEVLNKLKKAKQNQERNIMELEDVTNKKIKSIRFSDKIHEIDSWKGFYYFIIKKIYELDSERFESKIFRDNHQIKISKEDIRSPKQIGNKFYIETHDNSNTILNKIKEISESCGLEDTIQIQFK